MCYNLEQACSIGGTRATGGPQPFFFKLLFLQNFFFFYQFTQKLKKNFLKNFNSKIFTQNL